MLADGVKRLLAGLMILVFSLPAASQDEPGRIPLSFSRAMDPSLSAAIGLTPPSEAVIQAELDKSSVPYRFGLQIPLGISATEAGQRDTLSNGMLVWRLQLNSKGAKGLIAYCDRFSVPPGSRLFVYNPARTCLYGAFTSASNNKFNSFAFPLIEGESLVLEYNAPLESGMPDLRISGVAYAYRAVPALNPEDGPSLSGICEVNANCSEGDNWQKQKKGVVKIIVKDSLGRTMYCSGSMINNTMNNGIPYLLTANHCGRYSRPQELSQWLFYFGYEMPGCPNTTAPQPFSMLGAERKAIGGTENTGSDFFLVKLFQRPPDSLRVYFNGWSRDETPSPSGTGIHHPSGDVKKISTYTSPLVIANWPGNPNPCHWRVHWAKTVHGHGVTEGGSSGSPLFNASGLIVGTLTGGDSNCDSSFLNSPDYYGMFSWDWDKNGSDSLHCLKYWLDPGNTGVMSLGGWTLGTADQVSNSSPRLYPNPASEEAVFDYGNPTEPGVVSKIRLCSLLGDELSGRISRTERQNSWLIDLSGLPQGIYILNWTDPGGTHSRKLIKL
jgi:hypothetical protein